MPEPQDEFSHLRAALALHPYVIHSTIVREAGGNPAEGIVARVELNSGAWDISSALNAELLKKWRKVYDLAYSTLPTEATFDTGIWRDSQTGQPIAAAEMEEWAAGTVSRLLHLHPAEILEVGCGSGLLLYRLAPHCRRYVGLDYSTPVIDRLNADLQRRGEGFRHVEVVAREADALAEMPERSFDLVILNSVVQYFPSGGYLERILHAALRVVRPGGHVFVGDVRDRRLLKLSCLGIELAGASPETTCADITAAVEQRAAREPELLIEPGFFSDLRRANSLIGGLKIELKAEASRTEMTRFRYDVTLAIGSAAGNPSPVEVIDGRDLNLTELRPLLSSHRSRVFRVCRLQNDRLAREKSIWSQLRQHPDAAVRTLLPGNIPGGVEPSDIVALGSSNGVRTCLIPSESGEIAEFDVLCWPADQLEPKAAWEYSAGVLNPDPSSRLALQVRVRQERLVVQSLLEHLRAHLPTGTELPRIVIQAPQAG